MHTDQHRSLGFRAVRLASIAWTVALVWTVAASSPVGPTVTPVGPTFRSGPQVKAAMETADEARAARAGCITCHTRTDEATMHPSGTVTLGCATCHGGDPKIAIAAGVAAASDEYKTARKKAHPRPDVPGLWKS